MPRSKRLEKKGFVISTLGEPTAERGGRARTYFKPTPAGVREALEAHETLQRLSSGLSALDGTLSWADTVRTETRPDP